MTRRSLATPLPWLGALLVLYLVVPLVAFVARLASARHGVPAAPGATHALTVSVVTATITTALVALTGVPLAYLLARSRSRLGAVVGVLVQLPLALPPLMSGILLVEVVGPYTPLGEAVGRHLTDSLAGVVLAQSFVSAPFLVVTARSAFARIDPAVLDHAATLGHRPWSRFFRVSLPMAAPGVRAGLLLTWLRAFGEYGATVVLAYHPETLPIYTYVQFSGTGLPSTEAPTALALAVAAAATTLGLVPWRRWRGRGRGRGGPVAGRAPVHALPARPGQATPVRFAIDATVGTFRLEVAHAASSTRLALLGASGAGKSLTLRAIAGLLGPGVGTVAYGETVVDGVPCEDRRLGYVPQGYGLLPHLTVWEQVCFGTGAEAPLAAHWLGRLHLSGLEHRLPAELSGGQRQRVALAQALARSPRLLLLDEPFSALDVPVRDELRGELRRLQRELFLPTVLVTHDPAEAALLADEIVVVDGGRVLQAGARADVLSAPASPVVARLVGYGNVGRGRVVAPGQVLLTGEVPMTTAGATGDPPGPPRDRSGPAGRQAVLGATTGTLPVGTPVTWGVRPDRVAVTAWAGDGPDPKGTEPGGTEPRGTEPGGTVVDVVDVGATCSTVVVLDGGVELEARSPGGDLLQPGGRCRVVVPPDAVRVWRNGSPPGGNGSPPGGNAASVGVPHE